MYIKKAYDTKQALLTLFARAITSGVGAIRLVTVFYRLVERLSELHRRNICLELEKFAERL